LSAAVLTIIVFNLAMLYAINLWNRKIFDGLQNHDAAAVLFLSLIYFPLLAASVASTVTQVYVRMTLQRRWRAWLNDRLVDRWLANGRYYLLNLVGGDHQNPEFRIAEDVRIATEAPVEFAKGSQLHSFPLRPSWRCCGPLAAPSTSMSATSTSLYPDSWWLLRCSTRCSPAGPWC
jgi:ABC-type uncharacterized transport system fused permease/ATPase subunit